MISTSDQDGSQPPESIHPSSLPTTGTRNVATTGQREICRNYVWGTCNKGATCKFRHVFDFENMKKTLKFCHDYQNRTSCTREGCSYLHATKEEQTLFLATGRLPKVLADRHANISMSAAETIPQIAMYIQESLAGPPPPPPPVAVQPATSTAAGSVQPSAVGPMQIMSMGSMPPPGMAMGPIHPAAINMGPMLPPMMTMPSSTVAPPPVLPMHHLPPPPPPPTQPATVPQSTPPVYTAPPPAATGFPLNQPPPVIPPKFDASKPPPRLAQVQNGTLKRSSPNEIEAGPSKVRKEGESIVDEARCEYCQQRQLRIDMYKKEMDKLYAREEFQMLIYKKKVDECQKRKEILKTLISPDLYKLIDDYIEEGPQVHEPMNQNVLSTDRNLLVQVLDYFMNNDRTLPTSPRIDESLRTLLSTRSSTVNNTKPDTFMSFMELLRGVNKTDKDEKSIDTTRGTVINTKNDFGYANTNNIQQTSFSKSQNASTITTNNTTMSATSKATGSSAIKVTQPAYPVYTMPPPMAKPYMPQTSVPVASTSMLTFSPHNGVQAASQSLAAKPATCVPPPPPTNQKSQNSVSYPPPTPYYPYQ